MAHQSNSRALQETHVQQLLRQIIWQSLDYDMLDSAEFACERLLALDSDNPQSKHLMGLIYYRQRRYKAALNMTAASTDHKECLYIYAKCCLKLEMYSWGVDELEKHKSIWSGENGTDCNLRSSDTERLNSPDSVAMSTVLGKLYLGLGKKKEAVYSFAASARMNPYLWESIGELAKMGINLQLANIFKVGFGRSSSTDDSVETNHRDPFISPANPTFGLSLQPSSTFKTTFKTSQNFLRSNNTAVQGRPSNDSIMNTPTAQTTANNNNNNNSISNGFVDHSNDTFSTPVDEFRSLRHQSNLPLAPQKRSSRNISNGSNASFNERRPNRLALSNSSSSLSSSSIKRLGSSRTTDNAALFQNVNSNSNAMLSNILKRGGGGGGGNIKVNKPFDQENTARKEAEKYISDLYCRLTKGYIHFSRYECEDALRVFNQLASDQRDTPWVLSKIGRLHFELVNYLESEKVFMRLREIDKYRTQDMEFFSTTLWHLRKEVKLSFLAHELMDIDRTSPEAWCVLGNSFSLQRETDQALKCFKRAIQLDPNSAYAHTLRAHEHVSNDAYEAAQDSFRLAIRVDNRHYNAWYGLGMVFMRLGNIDMAEYHFERARKINPSNVVLMCCVGMVLEKKGRMAEALEKYKRACEIQPNSALSRYKKARALISLKLYNAALTEFDHLKTLAPDEASVHFLLGQLYKILQKRQLAVKHYTIALNLDPKGSHLIRDALEGLSSEV